MNIIYSGKVIFFCLEINPPCPNSVIEAIASGVPITGYDTGSLKELITPGAGLVIPYDVNVWKQEDPDYDLIEPYLLKIIKNYDKYAKDARILAKKRYNIENVTKSYLKVIEKYID